MIALLGAVAGFLTTVSFLPQVVRAWRTRQTRDLSLGMFLLLAAGTTLWLAYGVLQRDWPIVATNTVTTLLVLSIIVAKLRYR